MVDESMNYDSKARQEQQAGQATADVRSQMANANAQQNRALTGMGVNPNSGRFVGLSKSQSVQAGAMQAGFMAGTAYPGMLNSGYSNVMGANQQQISANLGLGQLMNQGYGTQAAMAGQQAAGQGQMTGALIGLAGTAAVAF